MAAAGTGVTLGEKAAARAMEGAATRTGAGTRPVAPPTTTTAPRVPATRTPAPQTAAPKPPAGTTTTQQPTTTTTTTAPTRSRSAPRVRVAEEDGVTTQGRPRPPAEVGTTNVARPQERPRGAPLVPGEGRVGNYRELHRTRQIGDDLTPNHMPQAAYMRSRGVARDDGIAMMMEQPHPGQGGRHRATMTYGRRPDVTQNPRDALAQDVRDVRGIYRQDGVYTSEIRQGLREVIEQNKGTHPELFARKKPDGQ